LPNSTNTLLWVATIFFMLLSTTLLFYVWRLNKRMKQWQVALQEANETELQNEKNIWNVLRKAAEQKDAYVLRRAVIDWGKLQWPGDDINSLDDISILAKKEDLSRALQQLDELLYSNHTSGDWSPEALLKLLNICRKEKKTGKKTSALKPLYQ
jgi:hypothetical protein